MGKCKTKAIQTDLGIFMHIPAYADIFRHNQTYSGIMQAYSEPCEILAYSEPSYIQNTCIFRTRGIPRTLAYSQPVAYSEPWYIQNLDIFNTRGILRTMPNIYDGAFRESSEGL